MSSKKSLRSSIFPLLFVLFIDALGFGIIFPVFTPLFIGNATGLFNPHSSIQLRNFWFEFGIAIYCLCMFLNAPLLGSLSDKYGRKKILMLSLIGVACGSIISAIGVWLGNIILILGGRMVTGATAGSFPIAQAAVVDISSKEQKARRIGLVVIANGIGFACGPVIGGILLDKRLWGFSNYQWPFWVNALLAIICLLAVNFLFTETFQGNRNLKIKLSTSFHNIYVAFTTPTIRHYCTEFLLFMTAYTIFFTMMPVFITLFFHKSGAWIGYYLTYFAIIFTTSLLLLLPKITGKFSLRHIILSVLGLQIIFYNVFVNIHNENLLRLVIIPIAISIPFAYIGLVTLLSNNTDSQNQGKIMGVSGSLAALSWGIGPLIAGVLGAIHFFITIFISTFLLLIAFAFLFFQKET